MADVTEGAVPGAGGQLSGEASRQAAIARMERMQEVKKKRPGPPGGAYGGPGK